MTENKTLAKGFSVKEFFVKNMVVVILICLILGFGLGTGGKFFSANNLVNLTTQMAINAMLTAARYSYVEKKFTLRAPKMPLLIKSAW